MPAVEDEIAIMIIFQYDALIEASHNAIWKLLNSWANDRLYKEYLGIPNGSIFNDRVSEIDCYQGWPE